MRKSDKEEASSKGRQNDVAPESVGAEMKNMHPLSDPVCKPIGLVFNPGIPSQGNPPQTVVVTGFLAIKGLAVVDCPVTITSLKPDVFLPQKTAVVYKNSTTVLVHAFYTPTSAVGVVYVYASNSYGATAPVGVVLNPQAVISARAVGQHVVTALTYPSITASGTVIGHVTIDSPAGSKGVDVFISSDTNFFQPQISPVHVPPNQTRAEVPTTVVLQSAPFTAHVAASCDTTPPFGPIDITVPAPTR